MLDQVLLPAVVAGVVAGVTIFLFMMVARGIGLVDHPEGRKQHAESTPMVGGIGLIAGLMTLYFTMPELFLAHWVVFASAGVLMLVGILDDLSHIHSALRMFIQIGVGVAIHFEGNLPFKSVGDIWFIGDLGLGPYSLTFTCIAVVGGVNAVNMMDGLDGLCGLIVGTAVAFGAGMAWYAGDSEVFLLSTVLLSVIAAFLLFNFRFPWNGKAKVFLGDSGAYVLGFLVAVLFLMASQGIYKGGSQVMTPVTALWLLFIPLIDIAHVIWVRSRSGRWPISDDRLHLHYVLQDEGLSTERVVALMFGLAMFLAGIGTLLFCAGVSESWSFVVFMTCCVIYFVVTNRMVKIVYPERRKGPKQTHVPERRRETL